MQATPPILLHGTSALHVESIRREGIKEACPGRGVALVSPDDLPTAQYSAWRAEWRSRYQHGSAERVGLGAVVRVDSSKVDDLLFSPCGTISCPFDSWYAIYAPASAIVSVETFALALPEVGSSVDLAMAAQRVGVDRSRAQGTPTRLIAAERIAAGDPGGHVTPAEHAARRALDRLRAESWQGLEAPSLHALRLTREHAVKTASPTDPISALLDAIELRRYAKQLSEPGMAALAIDGEFYPALARERELAAGDLLGAA